MRYFIIIFSIILVLSATALADWPQEVKLTASDGTAEDGFGHSVSIHGDYAIIGAPTTPWEDGPGCAYIFKRSGTTWTQKAKLTASDGVNGDDFGASVSICGNYAIVGAPTTIAVGGAGAAYIFEKPAGEWVNATQTQKLTSSDGEPPDHFGCAVSIDSNYAIIGAWGDRYSPPGGSGAGAAYIFKRSGTWTQKAKLTASDREAGDCLGYSVSISGNYAIVGNYCDDDNGSESGSAYIYEKPVGEWLNTTQTQKLTPSDAAANDQFGYSVSIKGDYAMVGSPQNDDGATNAGSAYIFKRNGTWSQQAKLAASDPAYAANLGYSVSICGCYAIAGAYRDDDNGNWSGSAYIFEKPGGDWVNATETEKLTASDGAASDEFGCAVTINCHYAIVGAHYDDDEGTNSGSAYIFRRDFDSPPVGDWHFDEGSGSTAYDETNNNNDGTITGADWTSGSCGLALYFSGGGQWFDGDGVTVPNSSSLDINGEFTVEAWIKATGSDNYLAIVDKHEYQDPLSRGFTLYLTTGRLRFGIYSGSHGSGDCSGTSDLRDDTWHHVAGTLEDGYMRVYVDCQMEGEAAWTCPPASTTNNLGIGKRLSGWGGYMPFLGVIDEVRISSSGGKCGDVNANGVINAADVVYLINYLYIGGPAPIPLQAGDVNCNGVINAADVVYLINYLFISGPAPCS